MRLYSTIIHDLFDFTWKLCWPNKPGSLQKRQSQPPIVGFKKHCDQPHAPLKQLTAEGPVVVVNRTSLQPTTATRLNLVLVGVTSSKLVIMRTKP